MEEIWRPVVGYEGLYEVSSTGRVRSLDRCLVNSFGRSVFIKGKLLKIYDNTLGYKFVSLVMDKHPSPMYVHRLVAQAFIPNPDGLPQVNHKDEDKSNNRVENLEWCTAKYNMNYGSRMKKTRETKLKTGSYSGLSNKEYQKEYYIKNRDLILSRHKEYNQDHKDEIRIYMKEYQSKYQSKYYQDHKEERRIYMREYQRKRRLDK